MKYSFIVLVDKIVKSWGVRLGVYDHDVYAWFATVLSIRILPADIEKGQSSHYDPSHQPAARDHLKNPRLSRCRGCASSVESSIP